LVESRHWEWSGCPRVRNVLDRTETACIVGRYDNESFFLSKGDGETSKERSGHQRPVAVYTGSLQGSGNKILYIHSWTLRLEIPRDKAIAGGRSGCEVKRFPEFVPGSERLQATDKLRRVAGGGGRPRPGAASLGLTGCSQVAMLGVRYSPANFGALKSPGSPNWSAQIN